MTKLPDVPRAVIFDMDGLLFDTEPLYMKSLTLAMAEYGYQFSQTQYHALLGLPWCSIQLVLRSRFGEACPLDDVRVTWRKQFETMCDRKLALKPGALELLDALNRLRILKAVATSSERHRVDHHLRAFNLERCFEAVVAMGDYSIPKPSPDPFLAAAARLGVGPSTCLALEDSFNGIRSAASAGMTTVMVPDLLEPDDEILGLCHCTVANLHEVQLMIQDAASRPSASVA